MKRPRNPAFLAFVHTLVCAAAVLGPCLGPLHAHHAGQRGLGQKAPDETAIPLCMGHHMAWHDVRAPFAAMDREARRAWADEQITRTQAAYEAASKQEDRCVF